MSPSLSVSAIATLSAVLSTSRRSGTHSRTLSLQPHILPTATATATNPRLPTSTLLSLITATPTLVAPHNRTVAPIPAPRGPSLSEAPGAEGAQRSVGSLAVVAVVTANPAAVLQFDAVLSVMDMASCAEGSLRSSGEVGDGDGPSRPYDIGNNPLHLFVGAEEGAAERGALLSCLIIAAAAMAILVARSAVALWRGSGGTSAPDAAAACVRLPLPLSSPAALPLIGFPSVLLVPAAFLLRMSVRAGVRLAVLAPSDGDAVLGAVAVALSAAYVAHVAYASSPLSMPRAVVCRRTVPPRAALPRWHRMLERAVGPSVVWVAADKGEGGHVEMGDLVAPLMDAPSPHPEHYPASAAPLSSPPPPTRAEVWLCRSGRYVAKARRYAWFGALQLGTTSLLKGLASAQTRASCLARNVASLVVLAAMLALLLFLRTRPVPSVAGWHLAVANGALLLACAVLNTANAMEEAQPLTNAVVYVGYALMALSAVGTCLSAVRLVVNAAPSLFGTERHVPTAADSGGSQLRLADMGGGIDVDDGALALGLALMVGGADVAGSSQAAVVGGYGVSAADARVPANPNANISRLPAPTPPIGHPLSQPTAVGGATASARADAGAIRSNAPNNGEAPRPHAEGDAAKVRELLDQFHRYEASMGRR